MTHNNVYDQFKITLPWFAKNVQEWFPNGKHSIRVRLMDGQEFIFIYDNKREWSFETMKMFMKRM